MTDWQVEVNHAIKETGLSFNTDALLAVPTQICHIQRITSENQQLREELEAATGGARGSGDPGHGALRIAAQGSIESLEDAFATVSGCGWWNRGGLWFGVFCGGGFCSVPVVGDGRNETLSVAWASGF
ncbi:hypothetical protein PV707_48140, partial [Streptomyces europaeiscabiei]|nr:hypothetical protein [Streptomyces europaeiscabiei]